MYDDQGNLAIEASMFTQNSASEEGGQSGGSTATYLFEYGKTTHYGHKTKSLTLPAGSTPVGVLATVVHLKANTQYYSRLVATNVRGMT